MAYKYIGRDEPIHDASGKVTGRLKYAGDIQTGDMLHVRMLLSAIAHGTIEDIDVTAAEALCGVVKVLTYKNTPRTLYDRSRVLRREPLADEETIFTDRVRFVGDRVAAVVAITPEIAEEALSLITIAYKPLPASISVEQARARDSEPIHGNTNVHAIPQKQIGDYDSVDAKVEHTVNTTTSRLHHVTMEPHSCVADYDVSTRTLTVWSCCQSVFGVRSTLAEIFNMPFSKVRVVKTTMGGSFGSKQETILEPVAAAAALATGRPCRLAATRKEAIIATVTKHPVDMTVTIKADEDGLFRGIYSNVTLDAGAYLTISAQYAAILYNKHTLCYHFPCLKFDAEVVYTNNMVSGSFRGWGASEAAAGIENCVNSLARKLGMDPVELRQKNTIKGDIFERTHRVKMESVHVNQCLIKGCEAFGWAERKERLSKQNRGGRILRGIGVAAAGHVNGFYPRISDTVTMSMRVQEDGSVSVNLCLHDHGCGSVTTIRKIISEVLDLSPDRIQLGEGDTDKNFYDFGCYSSRTTHVAGRAAKNCAEELISEIKKTAGIYFHVGAGHICLNDGFAYVEYRPEEKASIGELAVFSYAQLEKDLCVLSSYSSSANPGVSGVHFAQVAVDTFTGIVKVEAYVAAHDIGKAINPGMCRAQLGGAVQQGIGIALTEVVRVNPATGEPITAGLKNYNVVNAYDMVDVEVIFVEEEDNEGPFGAKSFGEVAVAPVAPALVAAVNDALGTELTSLPLLPPVILDALAAPTPRPSGAATQPPKRAP
ncbi:MAG: xanthine dehydrogenase family protein molybdopterin-binding subunit [Oscillospiraceae bacterium]|nr:xanthine dehydrogenase family protein molybdopterin-binding subunit [Oscillospiraceae bacterium]